MNRFAVVLLPFVCAAVAEKEKQRTQRIRDAEKALADRAATLPGHFDRWAKERASSAEWHLLRPARLAASNGARLIAAEDRSIRK